MALTQRLEFRQSQALVMTPQLMQAIKLLQLSNLDLSAYVEGELERNPLLERTGEGSGEANQPGEAASPAGARGAGGRMAKADVNGSAAIEDSFDTGIENVFPDAGEAPSARRASPPPIRNGPASARAGARTATTISKPSCRRSARLPTTWPSSSRWRSRTRRAA
jgi:RNA polymerase sigma-54 factor